MSNSVTATVDVNSPFILAPIDVYEQVHLILTEVCEDLCTCDQVIYIDLEQQNLQIKPQNYLKDCQLMIK